MDKNLIKIRQLDKELENALESNNFVKISQLSASMETTVKDYTSKFHNETKISGEDLELLINLKSRVDFFAKETQNKFKEFAGKTSTQTKMQKAYNKYGG